MCKCQHLARIKWIEPLSQRNWKYTGREGRGAEPRCVSCRDHVSATVHCATRMIGAGWQTPVIVMAVEALMICCCEASMTLMVVVNSDGRDDGGGGDECVCFLMTRFAQAHHGAAGVRRHRVRRHRVRRHSAAGGGRPTWAELPTNGHAKQSVRMEKLGARPAAARGRQLIAGCTPCRCLLAHSRGWCATGCRQAPPQAAVPAVRDRLTPTGVTSAANGRHHQALARAGLVPKKLSCRTAPQAQAEAEA